MGLTLFILFVAIAAVAVVAVYNLLVKRRQMVDNGWADIDVQLKRRADLIPQLVATVKGYAAHERTLFVDATRNYADRDSRLGEIVDTVEAIIHGGRDAPADEA